MYYEDHNYVRYGSLYLQLDMFQHLIQVKILPAINTTSITLFSSIIVIESGISIHLQ